MCPLVAVRLSPAHVLFTTKSRNNYTGYMGKIDEPIRPHLGIVIITVFT